MVPSPEDDLGWHGPYATRAILGANGLPSIREYRNHLRRHLAIRRRANPHHPARRGGGQNPGNGKRVDPERCHIWGARSPRASFFLGGGDSLIAFTLARVWRWTAAPGRPGGLSPPHGPVPALLNPFTRCFYIMNLNTSSHHLSSPHIISCVRPFPSPTHGQPIKCAAFCGVHPSHTHTTAYPPCRSPIAIAPGTPCPSPCKLTLSPPQMTNSDVPVPWGILGILV